MACLSFGTTLPKYHMRPCKTGRNCQEKICFFAHTDEQLHSGTRYEAQGKRVQPECGAAPPSSPKNEEGSAGELDFLKELRGLKIRDKREAGTRLGGDTFDMPDIDWVSDYLD
ncbi:zinc finger CCCH domain-containing protein 37-like [Aristolochia californica]|uniref:zinc finger CCCH domain-containing protein 37-like n=1 Tax=Aristolochia californica TaxID=171875 RepID=UPI0035DE44E4